ncbi:hypothetical protein Acsp06_63860 [Actinomycetospora sp. NBRC 106375]|uniref:hypothetical protein n=1 Tax=Actinomycetospora sp. NBRC 106375 TaxID=3032207 RepID=UPI0024A34727|nr:hypothetical protein [Actinomycetospora sp. NBRC 106375]GLZ50201.1 hypothetical protein Acsp06_63860 [Actinomycetospora sp. NBRC 106375]
MTDSPFAWPHDPQPDEIAAADPGAGAPHEAPGFGEGIEHDVFPEGDGETLEDELRDRPAPPFRTPHPGHE